MTDIDRILAEELPPDADQRIRETPAQYNASEAITAGRPRSPVPAGLTPFQPGQSGNPLGAAVQSGRYSLTRALREELTVGKAKAIARSALELAEAGSIRHQEFVRDTLEGKPGVRIADGEWNPETSPQFAVMQQFINRIVGEPQTTEQLPPAD